MSGENARNPRNLQGLLRFAMEATKAEDAPENEEHNFERMDPERRQFLENALKALTIDVIEQLQGAAETIGSESSSEDEKLDALELILNYTDDIDTAVDFCKIGGLFVLIPCLTSSHPRIRCKAASLVAELTQNNPYCQKELLEVDVLPKLVNLLSDKETATDGLRAISCMVRSYEPCVAAFIDIGGLECLLGCLQQTDQDKLIARSMFLLGSMCADFPDIRDELLKLKVIEQIVPTIELHTEYNMRLETTLSLLCQFTEITDAIVRCQAPELSLKQTLEEIIRLAEDKPECRETIEYSQLLLQRIFDSKSDSEVTDR